MTLLTALRTAATSSMVARHLARPDSRKLALIGAGSQSEFQALGMRAALGIEEVSVWDTDPAAMAKLARNLEPLGFHVHVAGSGQEAVRGADVVTTCTADKARATVLQDEWIAPGGRPPPPPPPPPPAPPTRPAPPSCRTSGSSRACTSTPSAATAPARPSSTPRSCRARTPTRPSRSPRRRGPRA